MINLTQHSATPEQLAQGVRDLEQVERVELGHLLTFDEIPSLEEMQHRAEQIYQLVPDDEQEAMLGGAPFFMSTLEDKLLGHFIDCYYAFSRRESVEEAMPDGAVKKSSVFKHIGFVPVQ
jgi:hypothetical protein